MQHVIPADRRIRVQGAQAYTTILQRTASGDWRTINASVSGIGHLTLEGGRYQGSTGDNVVLNGFYAYLQDIQINNAGGNGVTIGKARAAIACKLTNVQLRENLGYGIYTVGHSGSTDGLWTSLDIENSGLAGIRLDTWSQNLTNVHVWGSGLKSSTGNYGIWLNSTGTSW
ncbi:hypothetical protein ACWECW_11095 [Rhodococcus ruber]